MGAYNDWLESKKAASANPVGNTPGSAIYGRWLARQQAAQQAPSPTIAADALKNRKLGTLGRLAALLTSFESGNAVYKAMDRPNNTPGLDAEDIKTFLRQYISDVGEGVKDFATNKDTNQSQSQKKTYSDILAKKGMKNRKGKIDPADVLGLVGDIFLDPTTYTGAGLVTKGAKISTKAGMVTLSKAGTKQLKKDAAKFGGEQAQSMMIKLIETSPALRKKLVSSGGIRFMGKTLVNADQLAKVPVVGPGLEQIGKRGFITGGITGTTKLAEKLPVVGPAVTGAKDILGQAFQVGSRARNTPFEKIIRETDQFTKTANYKVQKEVHKLFVSAKEVVKRGEKKYGSVDNLGKAIYDYTELGKPLDSFTKKWVDTQLDPLVKQLAADETEAGLLRSTIINYLPHYKSKEAIKASGGGLRKITNINTDPSYAKPAEQFRRLVSEDGEVYVGSIVDKELTEAKYYRGITVPLTEGQTNWISDIVKKLKHEGVDIEFKPVSIVDRNAYGYFSPTANKVVIAADNPIEGIMNYTISHEVAHAMHAKKASLAAMHATYTGKTKIDKYYRGELDELEELARKYADPVLVARGVKVKPTIKELKLMANAQIELTAARKELAILKRRIPAAAKESKEALEQLKAQIANSESKVAGLVTKKKDIRARVMATIDPDLTTYYRKPTEIIARAAQVMRKDPALAQRKFGPLVKKIKMSSYGNALGTALEQENKALSRIIKPGSTFIDKNGKFWYDEGRAAASEVEEYTHKVGLAKEGENYLNPNVFQNMVRRITESVQSRESQRFVTQIKKEWGKPIDKTLKAKVWDPKAQKYTTRAAIEGKIIDGYRYRAISDIPGLEGVLLPEPIIDHLRETYAVLTDADVAGRFMKAYDKALTAWKITVTTPFQGFHLRNATGGIFNNWLAGVNPIRYYQYAQIKKYLIKKGLYEKAIAAGKKATPPVSGTVKLGGRKYSYDDIILLAEKNNLLGMTGRLDVAKRVVMYGDRNLAQKAGSLALRGATREAQEIESFIRFPLFMDRLAKGETARTAMESVMKFQFDYTREALTPFEQKLKRIIPFYTWTRNNIPLQLEQLGKQPGKYSAILKTMLSGDREQTWSDRENMQKYAKEQTSFRLPNGKYITVGLPMNDLFELFSGSDWAGKVSPMIKAPIEYITKYDTYRERPIVPADASPAEKTAAWENWFINAVAGRSFKFGKDVKTVLDSETPPEKIQEIIVKQMFGINTSDVRKYSYLQLRTEMLSRLSREMQQAYKAAHVSYENQYPLMASTRKASVYLDYPELYLVDQAVKAHQTKSTGEAHDPLYDLPWEKAMLVFGQQAKGDKWNAEALRALPWYPEFEKRRSAYFDQTPESGEDFKMEADQYYTEPSAAVQAKMDAKQWDDPDVQAWLDLNNANTNAKREAMGLVSPELKNLISENISGGIQGLKDNAQKTLWYMQALRLAGIPGAFDKWFEEHPDRDPLSDNFTGFASSPKSYGSGSSSSGAKISTSSSKLSVSRVKYPKSKSIKIKLSPAKKAAVAKKYKQIKMAS